MVNIPVRSKGGGHAKRENATSPPGATAAGWVAVRDKRGGRVSRQRGRGGRTSSELGSRRGERGARRALPPPRSTPSYACAPPRLASRQPATTTPKLENGRPKSMFSVQVALNKFPLLA